MSSIGGTGQGEGATGAGGAEGAQRREPERTFIPAEQLGEVMDSAERGLEAARGDRPDIQQFVETIRKLSRDIEGGFRRDAVNDAVSKVETDAADGEISYDTRLAIGNAIDTVLERVAEARAELEEKLDAAKDHAIGVSLDFQKAEGEFFSAVERGAQQRDLDALLVRADTLRLDRAQLENILRDHDRAVPDGLDSSALNERYEALVNAYEDAPSGG